MEIIKVLNLMWPAHHVKPMQSYQKQPKIHGADCEPNGNAENFLCPHMIHSMGVPGSDGNHVSESPSKIPLTSVASQLQEMDYNILDTPSLTQERKDNLYCPWNKPGPTWTLPHSYKLNGDLAWTSQGKN